jgi:hypothetical protein
MPYAPSESSSWHVDGQQDMFQSTLSLCRYKLLVQVSYLQVTCANLARQVRSKKVTYTIKCRTPQAQAQVGTYMGSKTQIGCSVNTVHFADNEPGDTAFQDGCPADAGFVAVCQPADPLCVHTCEGAVKGVAQQGVLD